MRVDIDNKLFITSIPRGFIPSPEFLGFAKLNLKFYPLPQGARGKTKIRESSCGKAPTLYTKLTIW